MWGPQRRGRVVGWPLRQSGVEELGQPIPHARQLSGCMRVPGFSLCILLEGAVVIATALNGNLLLKGTVLAECRASRCPWQPQGARCHVCHWAAGHTSPTRPRSPGCSLEELLSPGGDGGWVGALGKQSQSPPVEWRELVGLGTDSLSLAQDTTMRKSRHPVPQSAHQREV